MIENMNEILIVPDVHGRQFWRPALDYSGQIIFLGDYCDPYDSEGIGEDEAYENFLDIIDFKSDNPDRVTLLIGNHELGYFDTCFKCTRSSSEYYARMNEILTGAETRELFQICKQVDNYLFTHAGVTYGWYKRHFRELMKHGLNIEDQLTAYFQDSKMAFDETSHWRGGTYSEGSPLWAHANEFLDAERRFDKETFQIVGHTKIYDEPKAWVGNMIAFTDNRKLHILRNDIIELYGKCR